MRLGYFGGSFDPPHVGHLAVAEAAARGFGLQRVLFAPTGRQPLKPAAASAGFADRLAMTELLCAQEPTLLQAVALDAPRADGSPNYTVDTLTQLRRGGLGDPGGATDEVFVLVGADAFLQLPRWRAPDRLLQLAEWIVVSRPGFALQQLDALGMTPAQRLRVHPLAGVEEPASATRVREELAAGHDCAGLLPSPVLEYIRAHHLYGT
jgi:nicotinate-nucleotide adenylyltransferase